MSIVSDPRISAVAAARAASEQAFSNDPNGLPDNETIQAIMFVAMLDAALKAGVDFLATYDSNLSP